MNCSEVMVAYLRAAGINHIFGYPGDPNIEFMEAARRAGMEFVLGRREGTAGFMAQAYGFITGRPGVAMSTLGPGSSNLVAAVASAYLDRVPMIAVSGQIDAQRYAVFTHQVLDHSAMFSPVSKWTAQISPVATASVMRKALRLAAAERPGPVHITTPADVVGAECKDAEVRLPPLKPDIEGLAVMAADGAASTLKDQLRKSKRPVIVTGISAVRANAGGDIISLAEKIGCPMLVMPMSKGVVAEDHPYFAGTIDMACNGLIWDFLGTSDLILAVGFDAVELIKPWIIKAPTVHIDTTPNTDQVYQADFEIVGPIGQSLSFIGTLFSGEQRWTEKELVAHRQKLSSLYYSGRVDGKLNPTDVVDVVREFAPRETVVSCDVGSHKHLIGQGWKTLVDRGMLMTNGLSSMGYSLPAAIVSAMLKPGSSPICFIGDGSLAMVQSELRLAATLKLDMTVVVLCDNSLNRIEIKQNARQYKSWGTTIDATDTTQLAHSMGCDGIEVKTAKELEAALSAKRTKGRPLVVGAIIDPEQYNAHF